MATTITPDDMFRFRWIRDARLSPDGTKAVYEIARFVAPKPADVEGKDGLPLHTEASDLILVHLADGVARRLTSTDTADSGVAFSPDGETIAFVRKDGETPQIYTMRLDGGEPTRVTTLAQGVGSPLWSPDGRTIAFTAGTDWGKQKPDRSKDAYVVTRNVWRFDAIGDLDLAVSNVHLLDLASGETRQLTDAPTVDAISGWSPDGASILIRRSMAPDTFRIATSSLVLLRVDGTSRELIANSWGMVENACFSPDGTSVIWSGRPDDGEPIGTHSDLWRIGIEKADATPECLTGTYSFDAGGSLEGRIPAAIPNRMIAPAGSTELFVGSQIGGTVSVFAIDLAGGREPRMVAGGERTCSLCDCANGRLLFIADDINSPPDLYVIGTDASREARLTEANVAIMKDTEPLRVQRLEISGTDGAAVEGWHVASMTAASSPIPTILWIHGGPHGAQGHRFSFDTWVLAGAGYGVMFVNHRASTGYGDAFATAIKGDWGNLDYGDLMAGVDVAIERGLADPERLGVCGISGGGNLSCWTVGHTNRFKAAVPQNPVTNWLSFYGVSDIGVWFSVEELGGHPHEIPEVYAKCSPITYAHMCITPTLLIQNEADWRCPAEQSEQFYTVLRANGCPVEMVRHPGASHGGSVRGPIPARVSHLRETLRWFRKWV